MIDDLEREFLRLFLSSLKFLYLGKKGKNRVEVKMKISKEIYYEVSND